LSATVSSFQIKRRGVKAQMLENDPALGTFTTGAGMFNHGEEVGVDVSGKTPKFDNSKGHSITLYDTRADRDHTSNKPSIGFMDNNHNELASLSYDGKKLVSTKPIWWEGQDIGGGGGGGSSFSENEIELVAYFPVAGRNKKVVITSNFKTEIQEIQ
jgi:hypothetical protein